MCDDKEKEKKYKYYVWLDEMIIDLWCEYIDLLSRNAPAEDCDNKMKIIEFYQKEIDELSKDVSYDEVYEWWKKNYSTLPSERILEKIFLFP